MSQIELTYAFDAYCGWCYGFGPALRQFVEANADRVTLRVVSGGLFTGDRVLPIGAYQHIPGANERIQRLTGVTFGEPYQQMLKEGTTVMDSVAPALGLVALRDAAPERMLRFTAAIQNAWFQEGRNLRDVEVYRSIASEEGLDADAVADAYASPATLPKAQEDFRLVRRLGVQEYPTLLLHNATGVHRLGGPVADAQTLTAALDTHLTTSAA